jgi:hypothetical protein
MQPYHLAMLRAQKGSAVAHQQAKETTAAAQ